MRGYGMNGGDWVVMVAVWGVLLGLVVLVIARLVGRDGSDGVDASPGEPTAREVLDARLVRGEIDQDAYRAVADRLAHGAGW